MLNRDSGKQIDAVYAEDLLMLLGRFGIVEKFLAGSYRCRYCQKILTQAIDIYSILPRTGGVSFVCNKDSCTEAFTEESINKGV